MSTIKQCDRCGTQESTSKVIPNNWGICRIPTAYDVSDSFNEFELCNDCLRQVRTFLQHIPKEVR